MSVDGENSCQSMDEVRVGGRGMGLLTWWYLMKRRRFGRKCGCADTDDMRSCWETASTLLDDASFLCSFNSTNTRTTEHACLPSSKRQVTFSKHRNDQSPLFFSLPILFSILHQFHLIKYIQIIFKLH